MKSEIVFTAHIGSNQVDAFKAFSKAMKVKPLVEIINKKKKKKEKLEKLIKRGFNDAKQILEGKLKTTPFDKLINEL